MTTILVVPAAELEKQGRQLAHAISQVGGQRAAMWTAEHYRDNEPQISGGQPVIFLGRTRPAQDLAEVMPKAFESKGVTCHVEGHRAVVLATLPETQDLVVLDEFHKELGEATRALLDEAIHGDAEPVGAAGTAEAIVAALQSQGWSRAYAYGFVSAYAFGLVSAGYLLAKRTVLTGARARVTQAQFRYGVALFTADHLDNFLAQ